MKTTIILVAVLLLMAPQVWGAVHAVDQPYVANYTGFYIHPGYTARVDSFTCIATGNGESFYIYLYTRYGSYPVYTYGAGGKHGPFTGTVVGTGPQAITVIIDQAVDTMPLARTWVAMICCSNEDVVNFNSSTDENLQSYICLLYTSPSPRDRS